MTTWVQRIDYPMDGTQVAVLVAADADSYERISKCKKGKTYKIDPKLDNNADFHRLVMRLLRDLYEAQEQFDSEDLHREYVKLQVGWVYEARVPSIDAARLDALKSWLLDYEPSNTADRFIFAEAAKLVSGCVTQLVTRPLSFDKTDQTEREDFLRRLKAYAGPILGWEHVESYEGL